MGVKFNPFTSKLDIVDSPSGEFSDIELALGTQTAPSLSFTGDPNTGIYSPGADQVALTTASSERLRITSDGKVGIGTTSPKSILTAAGNIVGLSDTTHSWQHYQQAASSYTATSIDSVISGATAYLAFKTNANWTNNNATEAARIDSSGYLRLSATSPGIQFNGDTAAANALDDYEEGTFTPTIIGTATAGTATYTGQIGKYTKVGNLVTCSIYLNYSGGTGAGNLRIAGLPFTVVTGGSGSINFGIFSNIALAANSVATGYAAELTSEVVLTQYASGGGGYAFITYDAAGEILVSFTYPT